MNRFDYLNAKGVAPFVCWVARNFSTKQFSHGYVQLRGKKQVEFGSLLGSIKGYEWPLRENGNLGIAGGSDLIANSKALMILGSGLSKALDEKNEDALLEVSLAVMDWGGVRGGAKVGNGAWLKVQAKNGRLRNHLVTVRAALKSAETNGFEELGKVNRAGGLRFNSGMTKIYSLLIDDFIIYDSRVAAALAWMVCRYKASDEGRGKLIPDELRFLIPVSRAPERRNPVFEGLNFPLLNADGHLRHAQWNLRANWLIAAVIDAMSEGDRRALECLGHETKATNLRLLESGLFMIGYDVR